MNTALTQPPQTLIIYGVPFLGRNKQAENVEALQKLIKTYWEVIKESWKIPCHQQSELAMLYRPQIFLKEEIFGVVIGTIGPNTAFYERIPTYTSIQVDSLNSISIITGANALRLFDTWRTTVLGSTNVEKDFYFANASEMNPSLFLVSRVS